MGMLSTICQGLLVGIAAKFIYKNWFNPRTEEYVPPAKSDHNHGPPTVSISVVSVLALAHDLLNFEITSQVPEKLSEKVASSKKVQANWYKALLKAWKEARPPPKTPEQASRLVILTLHHHGANEVEGLLRFYRLPLLLGPWIEIPAAVVYPPSLLGPWIGIPAAVVYPPSLPEGVKFKLNTFPVDAKSVPDGDGLTVYVDVADAREATLIVPKDVQEAVLERSKARASKDNPKAHALHKTIVDAGYRIQKGPNNEDVLARKYRIRLRGIDAPENKQPFGKQAKKELVKLVQGKCVIVHVYGEDQYCRLVGDVHCDGKFAQEIMLKKGLAWHYAAYDKRPQLIKWEKDAKAAKVGLWASSNPEKPWEWRKNNPREGN